MSSDKQLNKLKALAGIYGPVIYMFQVVWAIMLPLIWPNFFGDISSPSQVTALLTVGVLPLILGQGILLHYVSKTVVGICRELIAEDGR